LWRSNINPLVIFFIIALISCAGPKSEEDQIRDLMDEAGAYAEKKDFASLMELFSDDYTDFRRRDKEQTKAMARDYVSLYRSIVVHVLSIRFERIDPLEASIQTDIAVSSGAAKALRKLIPVSTDIFRFSIELIKRNDRWLIQYAEWKPIGLKELFPESLSILKKIFPDE
jgi:hypothetical protein